MVPPHRTTAFLLNLILGLLLMVCLNVQHVAAADPEHTITYFDDLPGRLFYLADSPTILYHDSLKGNVQISQDEGRTWDPAPGVPQGVAYMVFEHPFSSRYAFILTKTKTHYRTDDRGKTWRSFEVPLPPAYTATPLSFHSDPDKWGYILYQGVSCDNKGWQSFCKDETFYTKEGFAGTTQSLLSDTSRCQFAHSSKDFIHDAHPDRIYCVAFDVSSSTGSHSLASSRLFSSTDFFQKDNQVENLGIGKGSKGVIAFAIVSKFAVVALQDASSTSTGEMMLYVTVDTKTWAKAQFPHASSARLRENAYTIVESTVHSLAVDVVLHDLGSIGTLFTSNSNGTYFVESLKDTNRNEMGFVDYENIYGVEGVGIANVVANAQDVEGGRTKAKQLMSRITFDDGSTWSRIRPPAEDSESKRIACNPADDTCSLHLHSVTTPHNFGLVFSSPAPGFVMGVGSIGEFLKPYDDCDTFLSVDAGLTWRMVRLDAHKYEFGDKGGIIVVINDEDGVDELRYSFDMGKSWQTYNIGVKLRARILITAPDSTTQKFLLVAQIGRKDQKSDQGRYAAVHLDFANMRSRQCADGDFEKWYARSSKDNGCLMGHKQWYWRRKVDANCFVGNRYIDPVKHEENCACEDSDYECDYNYIRHENQCVPVGPEPIEAGVCKGDPTQTYKGSSGWRLIAGNTCDRAKGVRKDDPIDKPCSKAAPPEGDVIHQTFEFPAPIVQHAFFKDSNVILVRCADSSVWQSSNEGYTWEQLIRGGERILAFYHHNYAKDRAYLLTGTSKFYYTTDTGRSWHPQEAPLGPNGFGAPPIAFHPSSDNLLWIGQKDCSGTHANCHTEAYFSRDHGRNWQLVESYVGNCAWARDADLKIDATQILCESWKIKEGNQKNFGSENARMLVSGKNYFKDKERLFENIVGFAKFSEYLLVAEFLPSRQALEMQISLDGRTFAPAKFPPNMHPDTHAYTILESTTDSVFLHMTMSEAPAPFWGSLLKSNWNGTYYGLAMDYVNRDERGYVDFEKMIGLDGIALINIVSNPTDAGISGRKSLQTRITHNDGGTWVALTPPAVDAEGRPYACTSVNCALHIHGYTERSDPRATYSTPSVVGLLMAVGNVGETLLPYTESDTFLSRDGGFTWEEVHKDAHLYEFGDSGSILVMANDEEPTDHVLFSTDEGLNWRQYKFTEQPVRVKSIVTVTSDTSRRFLLIGNYPKSSGAILVHIDFSALTSLRCILNVDDPGKDDFEMWSPSEERQEVCLFGRQTLYFRRKRDKNCVVGEHPKVENKIIKNCACAAADFECEFNHVKSTAGECVLVPGTEPMPNDDSCRGDEDYWYERTAYRKIPYSSCDGGDRKDRGAAHLCPGVKGHGFFFWVFVLIVPFAFTALVATYYYRRSGLARGTIRLPGENRPAYGGDTGIVATLASVPWFLFGLAGIAYEYIAEKLDGLSGAYRPRRGYRDVPVDADAQILRFEDEE